MCLFFFSNPLCFEPASADSQKREVCIGPSLFNALNQITNITTALVFQSNCLSLYIIFLLLWKVECGRGPPTVLQPGGGLLRSEMGFDWACWLNLCQSHPARGQVLHVWIIIQLVHVNHWPSAAQRSHGEAKSQRWPESLFAFQLWLHDYFFFVFLLIAKLHSNNHRHKSVFC